MIPALEKEIATFERELPTMLKAHAGEYVLIKGSRIVDYFAGEDMALRAGYAAFGDEPFLAMQVAPHEQHGAFSSRFAGPPIV
jgi:hypothetical protein